MIDQLPPDQKPRYRYVRCLRGDEATQALAEIVQHVGSGCQECKVWGNALTGEWSALQRIGAEKQLIINGSVINRCALFVEHRCAADA